MGINYAVGVVIEAKEALNIVDEFGREKFNEEFPREKRNGPVWYLRTEVIDSTTLEVYYGYGEDFENSFKVKLHGKENN